MVAQNSIQGQNYDQNNKITTFLCVGDRKNLKLYYLGIDYHRKNRPKSYANFTMEDVKI